MSVNIVRETVRGCKEVEEYIGIIVKYSKINNSLNPDLFNEQLMTYFKAKSDYDFSRNANFKTFLTTNLRNNLSNFIRDNLSDNMVSYDNEFLNFIEDSRKNTEKDLIDKEIVKKVLREINKLTFKKRYILKQRIFASKSYKEIGDFLDVSKQAVWGLYKREISKLKRKFGGIKC